MTKQRSQPNKYTSYQSSSAAVTPKKSATGNVAIFTMPYQLSTFLIVKNPAPKTQVASYIVC